MPMIDVRDTKLYYEMAGDGEPALVFVHGLCSGAWNWEDQMRRLSSEFTCVAYDRRGHSRSEGNPENQSDRTQTEDLAALIRALGLDRPIVIGGSSGAVITTELLRTHPDLVCGAILMEPPIFSLNPEIGQQLIADMAPRIEAAFAEGGPRAAVDVVYKIICGPYWEQSDEALRNRARDNAEVLLPTLQREAANITTEDLKTIDTPVLVIGGDNSPTVHRELNRILVDHLPDVRFVEVEDSGHVVFAEKPSEFASAVRAFAREISIATTVRA